jgi:hypothetical protein
MGYSIDMVVEGRGDQRLAIECDGDKYHGAERWADDMTRQRVLERVGWWFWRCWSSSYTIDPEGCMADLFATLDRLGIHPGTSDVREERYTEHRVATASEPEPAAADREKSSNAATRNGIQPGDQMIVRYLDDNKTMSFVLSGERDDPVNGVVASHAARLGRSSALRPATRCRRRAQPGPASCARPEAGSSTCKARNRSRHTPLLAPLYNYVA